MRFKSVFSLSLLLLLAGLQVLFAQSTPPLWLRTPSISPDGQQVAFSYRGALYVVSAQGGEARPLTTGLYYAARPLWTPDGQTIVYVSDSYGSFDIFSVSAQGGQPTRLTNSSAYEVPLALNAKGDSIYFTALYMPDSKSAIFYTGWTKSLYRISIKGGEPTRVLTHPLAALSPSKDGQFFLFEDVKGNEDPFRKHHVSSITRDIWRYDFSSATFTQLIDRPGEDRNPVIAPDGQHFYFLSERNGGSMNVYKLPLAANGTPVQVTHFEKNPVRSLSVANNATLCYTYDGEIYTQRGDQAQPSKLNITISQPNDELPVEYNTLRREISSAALSPKAKEVAYVAHGEVYVASVKFDQTTRITNTPTQERSVDFCSDGRTLVYAGERDGSWNLYLARIADPKEKSFAEATMINEEVLLKDGNQNFQPRFSPDGKKVAFLQNRTKLMVIDVASKALTQITDGSQNYSYADGDLSFDWSPDGLWLVMDFNAMHRWPNTDIGIVSAKGNGKIFNITHSGYTESAPKFAADGKMIIWRSDRNGLREQASWGAQEDVYAFFTTQAAYDEYMKDKFEASLEKKNDSSDAEDNANDKKDKKAKKGNKEDNKEDNAPKPMQLELDQPERRIVRLTPFSCDLADYFVDQKGKNLYFLCALEGDYNLWKMNLREKEPKQALSLEADGGAFYADKDGSNLLIADSKTLQVVALPDCSKERVTVSAPFEYRPVEERAYMFQHVWQQVVDKFYRTDLNGTDWTYYKGVYEKFLPHINNNYDFADLLSEMLGELNASHTGSGYTGGGKSPAYASTGTLGLFFGPHPDAKGLVVTEVLRGGPCDKADIKVKPGDRLTQVNGRPVSTQVQLNEALANTVGERIRITLAGQNHIVKPISLGALRNLLYDRWVEQRRHEVDSLSNGRLGYVHIRSMNSESYRNVYKQLFGLSNDREGVVIDTRYNGGGHLHEDIEVLFSGTKYLDQVPREHFVGEQPRKRWTKPSIMLIGEANYSNAHGTPWVYKHQRLGKLVGMPIPGTMTSVWWETLIDQSLYFGIPIVGYIDSHDRYLENQQLEPDVKVRFDYQKAAQGHDTQIEKAVQVLLQECDQAKGNSPWTTIDAKYSK